MNPQTGVSRGFAFVDFMTVEETETAQKAHNGALIEGSNIRVAFGTPGRCGASILGGHQVLYMFLYVFCMYIHNCVPVHRVCMPWK